MWFPGTLVLKASYTNGFTVLKAKKVALNRQERQGLKVFSTWCWEKSLVKDMQNIWKQKCGCSSGEWTIHTSINRKYSLENCLFQGQILNSYYIFNLCLFGYAVTLSVFIWIQGTTGQIRHLRSVSQDRSYCTQIFSLALWILSYIHHSISPGYETLQLTALCQKYLSFPLQTQHAMGLHFTHHSLVICTPFGSHQLFGNCLHLVLAWGVGGERKNLLSTFPTHIWVGPVNSVFGSLFKG